MSAFTETKLKIVDDEAWTKCPLHTVHGPAHSCTREWGRRRGGRRMLTDELRQATMKTTSANEDDLTPGVIKLTVTTRW